MRKTQKKHAKGRRSRHAKMQKVEKSMPGKEEAGMLKCRKREKACQNRRSRHAKMRKTRKSMPKTKETGKSR